MHHQAPGWYGKLSMLGDFASRRLDAGWIARIHAWIAAGLLASRERLGERWPQAYLGAPLWRFAWAPGIVDTRWWFGVLMPSCDSVGRYYPLVVVEARARPPSDRIGLDHLDLWWQRLAQATLATLTDDATVEAFEAALHDAPPWPRALHLPEPADPAADRQRHPVAPGTPLTQLAHGLAAAELVRRLAGSSIWWPLEVASAAGAAAPRGQCTVTRGLPCAATFAELLTGTL
ncbi:MAG: type VI secretion system-associated protein TagF [Burkholderiaceae bacterium]